MWRFLLLTLVACGGSKPPTKAPLPVVVEVATLPAIEPGFAYQTRLEASTKGSITIHTEDGDEERPIDNGEVRAFGIEVLSTEGDTITGLELELGEMSIREGGRSFPTELADKSFVLIVTADTTQAKHGDGTDITDPAEGEALQGFVVGSGLAIPVREVLVGHRLAQDEAFSLTRDQLTALLATAVPGPVETATITLRTIEDGVASFALAADGSLDAEAGTGTWKLTGSTTVEAATLLPLSVTIHVDVEGTGKADDGSLTEGTAVIEQSQTFTYGKPKS